MRLARLRAPYEPSIATARRGVVRTGGPAVAPPYVPPPSGIMMAPAPVPTIEKFRDPRAEDPDDRCRISPMSYLYWDFVLPSVPIPIPPDPVHRIALMRDKVEAAKSAGVAGNGVQPVADASHETLSIEARSLYNKYAAAANGLLDEKQLKDFADSVGQKVDVLLRQATPDYVASLASADLKTLGVDAWKLIGPQIMHEVQAITSRIGFLTGSAESATSEFADAVKAVPVISAAITWYVNSVGEWSKIRDDNWRKWCQDNIQSEIMDPFQRTLHLGYPYPWKVWDLDLSCPEPTSVWDPSKSVSKWDATPAQRDASLALKTNLRWMLDMERNLSAVAAVSRWWTLAMQLMTYGDVKWVFQAFPSEEEAVVCNDGTMAAGAPCGWQVASDEQVPLVAFPIAASYGFDPWRFTEELYRRSLGWRDPAFASLLVVEPIKRWHYTDDGKDIVADAPICGTSPVNAMYVQWAVLARDGFKLAEDAKNGLVPGLSSQPIGSDLSPDRVGALPVLGLGAVASGALYLAGTSIGVTLSPIAAAILYLIVRK